MRATSRPGSIVQRASRQVAVALVGLGSFALVVSGCSAAPLAATSATPSAVNANRLTATCSERSPCYLAAGTWVTAGTQAFIPGLTVTVPAGFVSVEADAGGVVLMAPVYPNDFIYLWKDIAAIESNGETRRVLKDVPRTPAGLTESFRTNPDFIVSAPTQATIAGGISGLTYVISVSPSAAYTSRGCLEYPFCVSILTDPAHWSSDHFLAIGDPEVIRLYLATVGTANDRHTFVIGILATDAEDLERFTADTDAIIASIRLPAVIGDE
jgi:hypothetical protein